MINQTPVRDAALWKWSNLFVCLCVCVCCIYVKMLACTGTFPLLTCKRLISILHPGSELWNDISGTADSYYFGNKETNKPVLTINCMVNIFHCRVLLSPLGHVCNLVRHVKALSGILPCIPANYKKREAKCHIWLALRVTLVIRATEWSITHVEMDTFASTNREANQTFAPVPVLTLSPKLKSRGPLQSALVICEELPPGCPLWSLQLAFFILFFLVWPCEEWWADRRARQNSHSAVGGLKKR